MYGPLSFTRTPDNTAILEVHHPDLRAQRERAMRRGQLRHIVDLARGRRLTVVRLAIPRRQTDLGPAPVLRRLAHRPCFGRPSGRRRQWGDGAPARSPGHQQEHDRDVRRPSTKSRRPTHVALASPARISRELRDQWRVRARPVVRHGRPDAPGDDRPIPLVAPAAHHREAGRQAEPAQAWGRDPAAAVGAKLRVAGAPRGQGIQDTKRRRSLHSLKRAYDVHAGGRGKARATA
jgi:hypothetical protein